MKTLMLNPNPDQRDQLMALGAKYVCPANWKEPVGWQVPDEHEAKVREIFRQPEPEIIIIHRVTEIGYDPGVTYYSVTYSIGGADARTDTLEALRNSASGVLSRGMEIQQTAVALYRAAVDAVTTHYYAPLPNAWGTRPKRHLA